MDMIEVEKHKILCEDVKKRVQKKFIENGWITVSDNEIHAGLVEDSKVPEILDNYSWDLMRGEGLPDVEVEWHGNKKLMKYKRFGNGNCEPFVFYIKGNKNYPDHIELSEEFRLFLRLHERCVSKEKKEYVFLRSDGTEDIVAELSGLQMEIKLEYLRRYLSARGMNLVIFFDYDYRSEYTYSELGISPVTNELTKDKEYIYYYTNYYNPYEYKFASFCNMRGKCVLFHESVEDYDDDYGNDDKYTKFIIGYDEKGNEVEFSCNQDLLSNFYCCRGNAPLELTPVFFNKEVLDKYYSNPQKYSVSEGYISCDGFWSLKVDNDCSEYVVVMLVDLGRLSYREQLYWKSFNIAPPRKSGLSETMYRRWILGQFCDPNSPDTLLKQCFMSFNERWKEKFEWRLFLPLTKEDEYLFQSLHCMTTSDNIREFESQILALVKMTVDSLNQEKLMNNVDEGNVGVKKFLEDKKVASLKDITQSIDKFELFLISNSCTDRDTIITFFRRLQNLRSLNVAHRKSSENKKRESLNDYFKLEEMDKRNVLDNIFKEMIWSMRFLEEVFIDGNKEVTALSDIK